MTSSLLYLFVLFTKIKKTHNVFLLLLAHVTPAYTNCHSSCYHVVDCEYFILQCEPNEERLNFWGSTDELLYFHYQNFPKVQHLVYILTLLMDIRWLKHKLTVDMWKIN
jgi:hypothetical protein